MIFFIPEDWNSKESKTKLPAFILQAEMRPVEIAPLPEFIKFNPHSIKNPYTGQRFTIEDDWEKITRDWENKEFKDAFRELSEQVEKVQSISIDELTPFLRTMQQSNIRDVTLMGVGFSYSLIFSIAVGVVTIMAFYLFSHLNVLYSIVKKSRNNKSMYPWLGLYKDYLSRIIYFISIVILPGLMWLTLLYELYMINGFTVLPNINLVFGFIMLYFSFSSFRISLKIQNL